MRLVTASPELLEFERRRWPRAPALVGVAFAVLAVLPWVADGPPTAERTLTSALFACGAAFLTRGLWSRPDAVRVRLTEGALEAAGERLPLAEARALRLTGVAETEVSGADRYRITLVLADGRLLTLVEEDDPARALEQLRRVRAPLPLPVEPGWGLPPGAKPWESTSLEPATAGFDAVARAPVFRSQRDVANVAYGGAVVVGALQLWLLRGRLASGFTTPLSWILPLLFVVAILVVAELLRTDRLELRLGPRCTLRRRALGVTWRETSHEPRDLLGAWCVGPGETGPTHLLLATRGGLSAHRCAGEPAVALADLIERWRRGEPPTAQGPQPRVGFAP